MSAKVKIVRPKPPTKVPAQTSKVKKDLLKDKRQ